MAKIPFKVSARAARLIGRENVANAAGAVIELVKNGYDADATISIVYYDNKYFKPPEEIAILDFKELKSNASDEMFTMLATCYANQGDGRYLLKENVSDEAWQSLDAFFKMQCEIYIIGQLKIIE